MKTSFIKVFLLFAFLDVSFSQTGWYQQVSGTGYSLNSVFFVDANTGFIVGDTTISMLPFQIILKTTNGGLNWVNQTPPFPNNQNALKSVYFVDANTGFACGGGIFSNLAFVIKTTNGGVNWATVYNQSGYPMQSIFFLNALTGNGVGGNGRPSFFRTTDGGTTWSNTNLSQNNGGLNTLYFPDQLTGYAAGPDTNTYKTTNGGANWYPMPYFGFHIYSIYFINSTTGWMAGETFSNYSIYKTTNGASNWLSYTLIGYQNSIRFVNYQTGWVCNSNGAIYQSTNGGANWLLQTTGITTALNSLCFVDAQTGWAAGANGRILKTTTGGITFIQPVSNEIPNEFKLFQNYPNPFNPVTKIKFSIPAVETTRRVVSTSIIVYDILGKEVQTLVNENLSPGIYEVSFDGSNLPSGVCFCRLEAGDPFAGSGKSYTETRKMLLLK
jgi:photosystem II stability/assembly factor-like uncharacterized protein